MEFCYPNLIFASDFYRESITLCIFGLIQIFEPLIIAQCLEKIKKEKYKRAVVNKTSLELFIKIYYQRRGLNIRLYEYR